MFDITTRTADALQTCLDFLAKMYPEEKRAITWLRKINPNFAGPTGGMTDIEFWENGDKEKEISFVFWFDKWIPNQLHRLQIVNCGIQKFYKPDANFELIETTKEDI